MKTQSYANIAATDKVKMSVVVSTLAVLYFM